MTTENINIRIREDGSRVVERNLGGIGDAAIDAKGDVDILNKALGLLAGALAIDKLQDWADSWGTAAGLIRTSTKSVQEATAVQDALYKSAQKTRTEYNSVVELYSRAARAGSDLGASQADLIKFSEGVGKALAIQGTSAEAASGALLQLGQALGNGKIQAEEYNSLLDNGQVILQTVANNLDAAGGSVGKLTKLVKSGQVGSKEFFDAFLAGSDQLDEQFGKTSMLFSQGWTVITNGAIKYVGQMNETLGISQKFGEFAQWMAAHMPEVAAAIVSIGAAVAVAFAPGKIMQFAAQMQSLWALMLANPFVAVAAAIAGVLSYLYIMRDEIKLGVDDTTTLGDLMRAVWEQVVPVVQAVWEVIKGVFEMQMQLAQTVLSFIGMQYDDMFGDVEDGWLGIVRVVARTIDAITGLLIGLAKVSSNIFATVAATITNMFSNAATMVQSLVKGDFAGVEAAGEKQRALWSNMGDNLGTAVADAFDSGFGTVMEYGLESRLNTAIDRAKEISKNRAKEVTEPFDLNVKLGNGTTPDPTKGDKDAAKKAAREMAQLQRSLRQLQDQVDPVAAATRELADAETILTKAVDKGLISTNDKATIYAKLKDQLQQTLQPYQYMIKEIERENEMLKLTSKQYEVEQDLYRRVQELKRSGIELTAQETDQLRAQLTVQQELARIAGIRDQLEQNSQSRKMQDLTDKVGVAGGMARDPNSGYTRSDAVTELAGDIPGLDQTAEFLQAQQEQYAGYYAIIDELRQQDLISETSAVQAKIAIFQQQYAAQFQAASTALGNLASLQRSENKKQAQIGKTAAIAQTMINTYQSATSAFAAMAGIPYVGPVLGAAAAAAAIAAGMANVQAIRSQNVGAFRTGGSLVVGGSGGTDSQNVHLRATPGERIQINTPAQARALERADEMSTGTAGPRVVQQTVNQTFMSKPDRTTERQQQRALRKSAMQSAGV